MNTLITKVLGKPDKDGQYKPTASPSDVKAYKAAMEAGAQVRIRVRPKEFLEKFSVKMVPLAREKIEKLLKGEVVTLRQCPRIKKHGNGKPVEDFASAWGVQVKLESEDGEPYELPQSVPIEKACWLLNPERYGTFLEEVDCSYNPDDEDAGIMKISEEKPTPSKKKSKKSKSKK